MASARWLIERGLSLAGEVLGAAASVTRAAGGRLAGAVLERGRGRNRRERVAQTGRVGQREPRTAQQRRPPPSIARADRRADAAHTPGPRPNGAETVTAAGAKPPAWAREETPPAPPFGTEERVVEETVLAGEFGEHGATDAPGPNVEVAPPWPGYDRMRARDIVDRLAGARAETAAAVRLYESANKNRTTVISATERALRGR